MAYTSIAIQPVSHVSHGYRLYNALMSIPRAIRAWNDLRITRNLLNDLSDQQLNDIGLVRGNIKSIKFSGN